ncbi:MAG: hypothetical protein ACI94Y_003970 [Maribacter sp.]|jgi:hypothetical protein
MGVHYRQEIKVYQVLLVLGVVFLIMLFINDFAWLAALKQYGVLLGLTAIIIGLTFAVLFGVSSAANISGLKKGTKVTDEREKEY